MLLNPEVIRFVAVFALQHFHQSHAAICSFFFDLFVDLRSLQTAAVHAHPMLLCVYSGLDANERLHRFRRQEQSHLRGQFPVFFWWFHRNCCGIIRDGLNSMYAVCCSLELFGLELCCGNSLRQFIIRDPNLLVFSTVSPLHTFRCQVAAAELGCTSVGEWYNDGQCDACPGDRKSTRLNSSHT